MLSDMRRLRRRSMTFLLRRPGGARSPGPGDGDALPGLSAAADQDAQQRDADQVSNHGLRPGRLGVEPCGDDRRSRRAVRTQLCRGADAIKVMAAGGVGSPAGQLESCQ
jgi:hypothetical protein